MAPLHEGWTTEKSAELYSLPGWGAPYFSVDQGGFLCVRPRGTGAGARLTSIVDLAAARGLSAPLLVRFDGILGHRLGAMAGAFASASSEAGFGGRYRPVYPIKVNQERQVVEGLLRAGKEIGLGLEVGSKPELMAVLALLERPSLVICNGYKDETYIELACLAVRVGHEVLVVIEKPSEIETLSRVLEREGREAAPWLGLRSRLASRGTGRWEASSGDRAKFGLSASQLVECVSWLREVDLVQRVRLLHFHIGSQVSAIRPWKAALREGARLYVELSRLGCPLDTFDVGGGLAVDYDGSRTDDHSSMNYSMQEYANDVVWSIHEACREAGLASPDIVTESGRALTAHHSVMIVEVTGATRPARDGDEPPLSPGEHGLVAEFRDNLDMLSAKSVHEVYHEALSLRDEMLSRFGLGLLDLPTRALCEDLFFVTCDRVARLCETLDHVPEDLQGLAARLADTYFCNFSVFQSAPDHWAIRQVFPVMPIQRLNEQPRASAVLGDMTCDSDGKLDRFPDRRDLKQVLEVHELRPGERYLLAICMVGAYQETLGDLHNLFGDTDTVHVEVDEQGQVHLAQHVQGESVGEVLAYVGYDEGWLVGRFDLSLDRLVTAGQLTRAEADGLREDLLANLAGNTYLTARSVKTVRHADRVELEDDVEPASAPATEPDLATGPAPATPAASATPAAPAAPAASAPDPRQEPSA
ncbi:MAG: arginine decarboxylase [Planctomycetota bacterium]|nr:MAG: arginine decarboxylase [Planctomycetota bacterium]